MGAEGLASGVAVEEGWEDAQGQGCRKEQRVFGKRAEDHLSQLHCGGVAFGDLHVVFGTGGLMAGGDLAVHPVGGIENLPGLGDLFRRGIVGAATRGRRRG